MTQPTEPQVPIPDQFTDTAVPTTAQWLDIYESGDAQVSALLRGEHVTRLLVNTEKTLPLSFAVDALKRWNTDPRRHFELDPDQWVKTYQEGTQPRYETTVETTFRDLKWTVIDTEPGLTVSVVETEQQVRRVRLDWSPEADLEPEEAGTVSFVDNALHDWNPLPGRQFQLDEEAWTQTNNDSGVQFETTVETTFQTVLELYLDTLEPLLPDSLVQTVVTLLSQQLPQYGVDYTSLFGSLRRVEYAPFARVTRTHIDNGEYFLEPENGWARLPDAQVFVPLTVLEPLLQAFESQLSDQEMTLNRKRHEDLLSLQNVYRAIAREQGVDLITVNSRRGHYLPVAYLQGTPIAPDESQPAGTDSREAVVTEPATKGYLDLESAVANLVEGLKTFETALFSAESEGVTQRTATELAAYLIHTLLWQPSGIPGSAINGQVVQTAIDGVVSYYESQYDALVEGWEVDAVAMSSEDPYDTEP